MVVSDPSDPETITELYSIVFNFFYVQNCLKVRKMPRKLYNIMHLVILTVYDPHAYLYFLEQTLARPGSRDPE